MPGYQVKIFDRNGIEIYSGKEGWDGTFKAKLLATDTYFYCLEYIDYGFQKQQKKGSFMLLR